MKRRLEQPQRGATMVVTLVFLILLSILAITAFKSSTNNLRVVGNMQARQEGLATAQVAIERVISSTAFTTNPDSIRNTRIDFNIDNDAQQTADYAVSFRLPTCYRIRPIRNSELNPALATDRTCIRSAAIASGIDDAAVSATVSDVSLCSETEWDITADVTDVRSGTAVTVHQGVGVRIISADATNSCN